MDFVIDFIVMHIISINLNIVECKYKLSSNIIQKTIVY